MKRLGVSRRQLFEQFDRPLLRPLPATRYEMGVPSQLVHQREETAALGVPCLTLRENTARPITVSRGTNRVIGVEPAAIYAHSRRAVDRQWPAGELPELWDAEAAPRFVKILLETR